MVENVFALPGIGDLAVSAIGNRDYPVIQGVMLVVAIGFVLINMLVDILYAVLDPRIRVRGGARLMESVTGAEPAPATSLGQNGGRRRTPGASADEPRCRWKTFTIGVVLLLVFISAPSSRRWSRPTIRPNRLSRRCSAPEPRASLRHRRQGARYLQPGHLRHPGLLHDRAGLGRHRDAGRDSAGAVRRLFGGWTRRGHQPLSSMRCSPSR